MGKRENDIVMRKIADMMVEMERIQGRVAGATREVWEYLKG